jgi:hypothetical protein
MLKGLITLFLAAALLGLLQCRDFNKIEIRHVVVIGVDGMSPDGIRKAATPVMDSLMRGGAYTLHARGVLPTSSSPNWASMISGAGPEQHGVTSNDWERDEHLLPSVVAGTEPIFTTIFGLIRAHKPNAEIGAIYHWEGFGRLFEKKAVSYDVAAQTEADAAEKAAQYLKRKQPDFTFVHLDHVDHAGHESGHGSPAYLAAIARADSLIGQIIQATREAGTFDQTLFIVTSDHGGVGKGHGGETLAEIEIPFILFGKGVKKGHRLHFPVYTYDNAATVAFALGLTPPYEWIGRPVKAAFVGYDDPATHNMVVEELPAPVIQPVAQGNAPAGGLFVDQQPKVTMVHASGKRIYYTVDGTEPSPRSLAYQQPFSLEKSTVIKAKAFDGSTSSPTVQAFFRLVSSRGGNSIHYACFEGENWRSLPDFDRLSPVRKGQVHEFRIDSIPHRASGFAVLFNANLQLDQAGDYSFYTYSDDGSKLWIDGKEVVDNDGDHGALERKGTVSLTAGLHPIRVAYFNGGGGGWLDVLMKGPGIPKQIIPANRLYPNAARQ